MRKIYIWRSIIISLYISKLVYAVRDPSAKRALLFTYVRKNDILRSGITLEMKTGITSLGCVKLCLDNPDCLSVNYCESLTCELKSGDAFSEDASLQKREKCSYLGMERAETVECKEKGTAMFFKINLNCY